MKEIDTRGLLIRIFTPTIALSLCYLLLGHFCNIPHILLFCVLGRFILVPIELRIILSGSKKEYGAYSLKSAFIKQEEMAVWKVLLIAFIFFGMAGLLSAFIASVENQIFISDISLQEAKLVYSNIYSYFIFTLSSVAAF